MFNLYFVFPYRGIGGVSLLFLRFAEFLAKNNLAKCTLVDYSNGFMAKNRQIMDVKILEYTDIPCSTLIPGDATVIFQSMTPWSIFPGLNINPNAQVLFWNCHPFNLIPLFPGLRLHMANSLLFSKIIFYTILFKHYSTIRRFVSFLDSHKAIVFMDKTNLRTTQEYLNLSINGPRYVPVALDRNENLPPRNRRNLAQGLKVVWVGRIVDFKFFPLIRSLIVLNSIQPKLKVPVMVTIIGDGNYNTKLREEVSSLVNLTCDFVDHIPASSLDTFLSNEADLLLAMGTSALEGAKLGIPTILLDIAYVPVSENYVFTWLHQRQGFTLGELIDDSIIQPRNRSLHQLIEELFSDHEGVSQKTFDHFMQNHEISNSAIRLIDAVRVTECKYGQLKMAGLLDRGFLYSMFSFFKKRIVAS